MCQKYRLQIVCFGFFSSVVKHCMVATYMKKIMHNDFCDSGVYSRETINIFCFGRVSGHVENFNIGIYSDSINVLNVKICMMVLLIELYLFIPLSPWECSMKNRNSEKFCNALKDCFFYLLHPHQSAAESSHP